MMPLWWWVAAVLVYVIVLCPMIPYLYILNYRIRQLKRGLEEEDYRIRQLKRGLTKLGSGDLPS